MLLISVKPGEEVIETVTARLREHGITSGAIVSIIGAVESACISNMPEDDATSDVLSEYKQPMEMSGNGEVKDGIPHIHAVFGTHGDATISGHLHWARVATHFVNLYVVTVQS